MKNKGNTRAHQLQKHVATEKCNISSDNESPNTDSRKGMTKDANSSSTSSKVITLVLPRWIYCYAPIICVIGAVIIGVLSPNVLKYQREKWLIEKTNTLGWEVVDIFSNFDEDGDAFLSLEEAEPLLLQVVTQSKDKDSTLNLDIIPGEDSIWIEARFSPLNLSTMIKDFQHDILGNQSLKNLFAWQTAHIPTKAFGVSNFLKLMPDEKDVTPTPGHIYTIVEAPRGILGSSSLSSNRYYPPRVVGRSFILHRLLSMFHPRPFLVMRFPPQGILACVRAVSEKYVELVFRMHTEFQLNEPPDMPFWFTPAQFTGSLIISRDGSSVEYFHLFVPNERRLNVDMEWLTDRENVESMEVDIGYMPLMELVSQAPSSGPNREPATVNNEFYKNIKWDSSISVSEAREYLEQQFFPFKQVSYYNLSDAFDHAKSESKLVHSILLWGALDDQSC